MIEGVSEIIVYAKSMPTLLAFYRDVLSLEVSYESEHWTTFRTGACTLALHSGSEGDCGKDAPKFVFATGDIEGAHAQLAAHQVKLGLIREPAPGVRVFDAVDPEGNVFSIEQS